MRDIIIIGAGVIGTSIAHALAKYNLKVLVIEKNSDVGDGASGANSAIIHSGYDPKPGTLKAKLNVLGNKMFDEICQNLDVKLERIGSITLALNDEEIKLIDKLAERALENGVNVQILEYDELKKIEPNITTNVKKGLFAPSAAIINPFELTVALMENAMDNGVELLLNHTVIDIKRIKQGFEVKTNKGIYKTRIVINASGVYTDEINEMINLRSFTIQPRRGEYYVLDHFDNTYVKHVLFNVPSSKGKGVLITPTTHGNYLIGPSSDFILGKDDLSTTHETLASVKEKVYRLVDVLPHAHIIRQFSGIRAVADVDDFIIEETSSNFINVAGIQSPGFASAPAIAKMVADMIPNKEIKKNYNPKRRPLYRINELSIDERQELIKKNPKFGRIICRCEQVSEAEVVDAIHRNCGATTVKGVKKRVRPGFGKCQGGFCEPLVVKILSRELHKEPNEIMYANEGSYILLKETKGDIHD